MKTYPSDIRQEQYKQIARILETARKRTKPRKLELYAVFNAVLYVMKTGCQWRALPSEYPKWRSVHRYFQIWSKAREGESATILEVVLKKIGQPGTYGKWKKTQDIFYHR